MLLKCSRPTFFISLYQQKRNKLLKEISYFKFKKTIKVTFSYKNEEEKEESH